MKDEAFFQRFDRKRHYIGQDTHNEEEFLFFYDDGKDVGVWRYNPRNTTGYGELLTPMKAEEARSYYRLSPVTRREQLAELDLDQVKKGQEAGFNGEPKPDNTYTRSYHHGWKIGAINAGRIEPDADHIALGKSIRRWTDVVVAAKGLETPTEEKIRKGLERALMILDRDGIAPLRGKAWNDSDRDVIEDGLKALNEQGIRR